MGYHRAAGTSRELGKVSAFSRKGWGPDHGNLSMALQGLLGRQELSALTLPSLLGRRKANL